jgi:hypothetical protein
MCDDFIHGDFHFRMPRLPRQQFGGGMLPGIHQTGPQTRPGEFALTERKQEK